MKANEILKDQTATLNQEHQAAKERVEHLENTEKETLDQLSQTDAAIAELAKTTNPRLIESRNQLAEKQTALQNRLKDLTGEKEKVQATLKETAAALKELGGDAPAKKA